MLPEFSVFCSASLLMFCAEPCFQVANLSGCGSVPVPDLLLLLPTVSPRLPVPKNWAVLLPAMISIGCLSFFAPACPERFAFAFALPRCSSTVWFACFCPAAYSPLPVCMLHFFSRFA
jgi:hypothetical protein